MIADFNCLRSFESWKTPTDTNDKNYFDFEMICQCFRMFLKSIEFESAMEALRKFLTVTVTLSYRKVSDTRVTCMDISSCSTFKQEHGNIIHYW